MSSPVQAVPSPLQDFLQFLQHARDTAGIIKLVSFNLHICFQPNVLVHSVPATILESTTQYLLELSSVPRNHVEEMLAVIDQEESVLCSRLELHAFTIVYEILSLTEEGSAYERGLALLTVGNSSEVHTPTLNYPAIVISNPHLFVAGKQTASCKESQAWRHGSS